MSRQLNWIVDPRPTAFHAAAAIHAGFSLTDPSLATTIAPAVITLGKLAAQEGFSTASLWQHLIPLSAHEEGLTQLSEAVVRKLMGRADRAALLEQANCSTPCRLWTKEAARHCPTCTTN